MTLTANILRKEFFYDPVTGQFTRIRDGLPIGSKNKLGYLRIWVGGKLYACHRLAWLYVYGTWPAGPVDHINRNKSDNRILNLREANKSQNGANSIHPVAVSGRRGVYNQRSTGKWRAKLGKVHLGYFYTKQEAHDAYVAAHRKKYGEFSIFAERT